ncbi:MAG: thiamine phosphate synthase [Candidatus Eremiobacteraeota bacterium]|nr:thiamine phosphate synthase [Candidatus Eremiobacteraeota bacterium]
MEAHASPRVTRDRRADLLRGIYLIVNEGTRAVDVAHAALRAGVRIVQYRAKSGVNARRLHDLRALTRERDALLIANDDWRAALDFDCDGVHLGPGDEGFAHVAPVRAALGERLIGLSCGTVTEARAAETAGADYVGVGSVFATGSKADAGDPIGIAGLIRVAAATRLPVAAIGGIGHENLATVAATGVSMAATISAIAAAADPAAAAAELVQIWNAR